MAFFDLDKSIAKWKKANTKTDTVLAGAEIAAKGILNTGLFIIEQAATHVISQGKSYSNNENISPEKREQFREATENLQNKLDKMKTK